MSGAVASPATAGLLFYPNFKSIRDTKDIMSASRGAGMGLKLKARAECNRCGRKKTINAP